MALDIVSQDLIIDETAGLQNNDIDPSVAPYDTDATVDYLLSLDAAGGLSSPEVAFQADFVVASANAGETINAVVLAQDAAGTAFSTTVGVNSGIKTVDGNYVWLFQDSTHANVVIGVIGTSSAATMPAASGPLAYSFALVNTSATNADLYTVQYVPLIHPDATDPDDRIDLADKVYASVLGTTTVNFSQLGDAPPGHNNWYILDADAGGNQKILVTAHDSGVQANVNVSTQGLGVASQDVRFGRELQIDLISGGTQSAGKNFTNSPLAPDYGSHLETISSAGFSVSQSTPTNSVADIEIHAFNNNDNAEGAALPGDDNDTEINITGVTFKLNGVTTTAAALGITIDDTGAGLILYDVGLGVTVDFTTAGGVGGTFDRFTIKNIDSEKDYFDVKEVHYGSDTTSTYREEVGSFINFDDDGPTLTGQVDPADNNLQVANILNSHDSSSFTVADPGTDGLKSFGFLNPDSGGDFQWAYYDVNGDTDVGTNEIKGTYKGNDLYTLVLNSDGTYTFEMIGTLPGSTLDLNPAEVIKAGSPDTPTIEVGAVQNDDYVEMTGGGGNINESHGFVGVTNGNVDLGESITFKLFDGDDNLLTFQGIQIGTKSAQGGQYSWTAHVVGGGTISSSSNEIVGKNGTIDISSADLGGATIDSITIMKESGSAIKIGVSDIHIIVEPEDVQLGFDVQLKDGDNDTAPGSFVVDIDGNNDGNYDATGNSLAVTNTLSAVSSESVVSAQHQSMLTLVGAGMHSHHHDYLSV